MSKTLERLLAVHSSPAICGIKASNLISIDYTDSLYDEIEELNKEHPKLCFHILKRIENKVLVLVYRKNIFNKEIYREENISFLESLGYDTSSDKAMLKELGARLNKSNFPHEIGVFLGYDLSDIKAFIRKEKCLYVGHWQVYSKIDEKKKIFNKYNRCRDCVVSLVNEGFPIENFMR